MAQNSKEYQLGFNAFINEGLNAKNPYDTGTRSYTEWDKGFKYAVAYESGPTRKVRSVAPPVVEQKDMFEDQDFWIYPVGTHYIRFDGGL